MRAIHKYAIDKPVKEIELQAGAIFLHLDLQNHNPVVYFLVETQRQVMTKVKFAVVGTGHSTDHLRGAYVGSVQDVRPALGIVDSLVWHVFVEDKGQATFPLSNVWHVGQPDSAERPG